MAADCRNRLRPTGATLIRRVTFDLIGLPPTPEEVEAFVADDLADWRGRRWSTGCSRRPHYGERWARHWLDVARYADSNGLDENTAFGNAWRYRDYVIAAFNADKPYDQFVREQLAGDLLPPIGRPRIGAHRHRLSGARAESPRRAGQAEDGDGHRR